MSTPLVAVRAARAGEGAPETGPGAPPVHGNQVYGTVWA